jgi:hypothetical protein
LYYQLTNDKKITMSYSGKLINALFLETAELKTNFIEKTLEFAKREYEQANDVLKMNNQQWCIFFNIEPVCSVRNSDVYYSFPSGFYNTENAKKKHVMQKKADNIIRNPLEQWLDSREQEAVLHYEKSIEKLAGRIASKGLDLDSLKFSTCSDFNKGNIETIITDAKGKKVRAFTILAWGEVNAPHYRYLVK